MTQAALIAAARRARGWTQTDLAYRADISHKHVANIEHGRCVPSQATARRIEKALAMEPGTLTEPSTPSPDDATVAQLARAYVAARQRMLANYNQTNQAAYRRAWVALEAAG